MIIPLSKTPLSINYNNIKKTVLIINITLLLSLLIIVAPKLLSFIFLILLILSEITSISILVLIILLVNIGNSKLSSSFVNNLVTSSKFFAAAILSTS